MAAPVQRDTAREKRELMTTSVAQGGAAPPHPPKPLVLRVLQNCAEIENYLGRHAIVLPSQTMQDLPTHPLQGVGFARTSSVRGLYPRFVRASVS